MWNARDYEWLFAADEANEHVRLCNVTLSRKTVSRPRATCLTSTATSRRVRINTSRPHCTVQRQTTVLRSRTVQRRWATAPRAVTSTWVRRPDARSSRKLRRRRRTPARIRPLTSFSNRSWGGRHWVASVACSRCSRETGWRRSTPLQPNAVAPPPPNASRSASETVRHRQGVYSSQYMWWRWRHSVSCCKRRQVGGILCWQQCKAIVHLQTVVCRII